MPDASASRFTTNISSASSTANTRWLPICIYTSNNYSNLVWIPIAI
jgi:hypothetical protein